MNTKKYAVIDTGSNTMVLVIYEVSDTTIRQIYHLSTATHLVDEIKNKHMQTSGIVKAFQTAKKYVDIAKQMDVAEIWGDITECGRGIDNGQELIQAIEDAGVTHTILLTGEQEAQCDFYGSRFDQPLHDGLLIDIGGGSTEFVRFTNGEMQDAVSIPLGCVRLSHLPLTPSSSMPEIERIRSTHPSLTNAKTAIGVGGTIRACKNMCKAMFDLNGPFTTNDLNQLYEALSNQDPLALHLLKIHVKKDRQEVFLPGLGMLVAAAQSFQIDTFYNSEYGVREGFLVQFVLHDQKKRNFLEAE